MRSAATAATAPASTDARAERGRFGKGNQAARDRGAKQSAATTSAAKKLFASVLRWLGVDVQPVRNLAALHAEHMTNFTELSAAARKLGLDTPDGQRLAGLADEQSKRAERTLVTAQDMARIETERAGKKKPWSFSPLISPPVAVDASDDDDDDDEDIDLAADHLDDKSEPVITQPAQSTTPAKDPHALKDDLNPTLALARQQDALKDRHAQYRADRNRIGFDPRVIPPPIVAPPVGIAATPQNFAAAQAHAQRQSPAMGYGGTLGNPPIAHWPPQSRALRVLSEVEQAEQDEEGARLRAEYARLHPEVKS